MKNNILKEFEIIELEERVEFGLCGGGGGGGGEPGDPGDGGCVSGGDPTNCYDK